MIIYQEYSTLEYLYLIRLVSEQLMLDHDKAINPVF